MSSGCLEAFGSVAKLIGRTAVNLCDILGSKNLGAAMDCNVDAMLGCWRLRCTEAQELKFSTTETCELHHTSEENNHYNFII
jgi:hypothetical protein